MMPEQPPRDNLLRASYPAVELRSESEDGMPTMVGHFARFNEWTKIDSTFEGRFMERVAPGAFRKTLSENRDRVRVLFQHGRDPQIGDKPLGPIADLREDDDGAYYEVPLLDTSYNRDLLPGLRAGLYGASFRFSVPEDKDDWNRKPDKSPHNPDGLPERTIREARLMEFGPVTFPAYAGATAGVRSVTFDDLDAAVLPPEPTDALPADGAAAEPHSDEGSREVTVTTPAPKPKEKPPVDITQYRTRDEMVARRRELDAEITRMAELPGVLSDPEQAEWDARTEERTALDAAISAWDARLEYAQKLAGREENTQPFSTPNVVVRKSEADIYDIDAIYRIGQPEKRSQAFRDNAMRAVETVRFAHPEADTDKSRDKIADLLDNQDTPDKELAQRVLQTGAPIYRRVFNKYLAGRPMTAEEQRYAALTVQTDATGGYSVPFYFDPTLVHVGAHTAMNPYRRACRVIPIVGTDTYHGVTAAAVLAARAAEAAAVAEGGGAVGQISAIVGKVHSMVTVSIELLSDRPDWSSELASLIAEAKDTEEENIFTNGIGDALGAGYNPIGMLPVTTTTGAYTEVETATNNTFAIGDLYTIEAAVPIRHRMNAAWFMGRATIRAAQAMETTGGQLFGGQNYASVGYPQNDPFGNTGLRLLNYPVWEVPSAVTGVADSAIIAALADPSSFYIIERVGMSVEVIPHAVDGSGMPTGQRRIYAWWRNTAKPSNVDAGRRLRINPA